METLGDKILPKFCSKYCCEYCHYNTCKKSSYDSHLLSERHKKRAFGDIGDTNSAKILPSDKKNVCEICKKTYMSRNGLWKHKQKCFVESDSESDTNDEPTEKELIMMLIKQNTQLIEQNASLVKNGVTNTTNSHNTNHSHNKTFNLQFFLNETCKDAMNLTDFVNSIQLQLSDLEKMGEIGYTQGLSNIILNNLNELDVTQRPVHCADKKREVLYVKDEDKWEKEQEDKKKLRKAIRRIADKNCFMLNEYKKLHPDCTEYHSKYGDKYNKMMYEAYGGKGDNEIEKENKIIRNIAKNVAIDKDTML
jgi:Txe/YoeB family toxin of Txe-Axe toxin-antitoxin module